jgi:hypothetical protein
LQRPQLARPPRRFRRERRQRENGPGNCRQAAKQFQPSLQGQHDEKQGGGRRECADDEQRRRDVKGCGRCAAVEDEGWGQEDGKGDAMRKTPARPHLRRAGGGRDGARGCSKRKDKHGDHGKAAKEAGLQKLACREGGPGAAFEVDQEAVNGDKHHDFREHDTQQDESVRRFGRLPILAHITIAWCAGAARSDQLVETVAERKLQQPANPRNCPRS